MTRSDRPLARRAVIKGAGLGLGAGLVAQLSSTATAQEAKPAGGALWSNEYWAQKGDVKLSLYRKRVDAPKVGEAPRPVLFMVHGSSISSRPTFDLTVPGKGEYSMMN